MRRWLEVLVSGCAVYCAVAACGAGGPSAPPNALSSEGGQGQGGTDGAGAMGGIDGSVGGTGAGGTQDAGIPDAVADGDVWDAITDPVPDAVADTSDDADDGTSGSRLKVQRYAGTDGSNVPTLTLFDSELGVQCAYGLAADGATRCIPSAAGIGNAFGDEQCTQPVFYVPKGACGRGYDYGSIGSGTCGARRIFKLGAVHSGEVFMGTPGACNAAPNQCVMTPALQCDYKTGTEMGPESFVQATIQTDA